jgi:subtilisin family serine protease
MTLERSVLAAVTAVIVGCGGQSQAVRPNIDPVRAPDSSGTPVTEPGGKGLVPAPSLPPAVAFARGLMPLKETGVDAFRQLHPTYDGRGVIIAVLDGGIDAGVPGLITTSTGDRKLLDLRDFSGEGRIALEPAQLTGDSIRIAGKLLRGMSRVASLAVAGSVYTGVVSERAMGEAPAADLNGNGEAEDLLPVVVGRASDGWFLLADTDGDGTLANQRPVHDYLEVHETFGWSPRGRPTPMTIAVNLARGPGGAPSLDLFFDGDGHGSHVAGIAAGHDLYGVAGFDGVAPGAQVIGLKIARDALGGISVTGSMLRAMDYAIRFAKARGLPLVMNMSYGVGNEVEGSARIDGIVDSVLAANPGVVFTISAGNDGPGLSTLGFPGSATRPLTVGATYPGAFLPAPPVAPFLAYFSSRGGELAKPDLVTPGFAYSTVPRWAIGDEQKEGTSMAAPYATGLVARLVSGLAQEHRPVEARSVKQALMVTARPLAGQGYLDQGTGLPQLGAAWVWIREGHTVPEVLLRAEGQGASAAIRWHGLSGPGDTTQAFTLQAPGLDTAWTFALRTDASWLAAPPAVAVGSRPVALTLSYRPGLIQAPGTYSSVVTGWTSDTLAGPAFRLLNTVVVPQPGSDFTLAPAVVPATSQRRYLFAADSGRPFIISSRSPAGGGQALLAFLEEPGGQPFREGGPQLLTPGDSVARFQVDGRDVVAGLYELTAVGSPYGSGAVGVSLVTSPLSLAASSGRDGEHLHLENHGATPVSAAAALFLIGSERSALVAGHGGNEERIAFTLPAWARRLSVDLTMDRDQWPRFTDFGVTLIDSSGHRLRKEPLNYAFGRLSLEREATDSAVPVALVLSPGLADSTGDQNWTVRLSIRLYADSSAAVNGPPVRFTAAPGAATDLVLPLPANPLPLGDAFFPLGLVGVPLGDETWTWEVPLSPPARPLAR